MPLYPANHLNFINLADYCKLDGSTDDSIGFTAAYNLAAANNMALFHPGGTLVKGNDTILSNVFIIGTGRGVSTIKLKNAANTDLFSANTGNISLSAAFGTGSTTGATGWGMSHLTLDGNKANQSSGTSYPLRWYGYGERLEDVEIINGYTGGILRDWHGTLPSVQTGYWRDVEAHSNNGIGIQTGGPTDQVWDRVDSHDNGSHCYHIAPNSGSIQASNCHGWGAHVGNSSVTWLLESNISATNCEAEGSDTANVVMVGSRTQWIGGQVFAGQQPGAGFKIGQQSGETPYSGQILQSAGLTTQQYVADYVITTLVTDITSTHGAFWLDADAGGVIYADVSQSSQNYVTGIYSNRGTVIVNAIGLTEDGSIGKSAAAKFRSSAYSGFTVGKTDGTDWFTVDTYDGVVDILNGSVLVGYSDAYNTVKWQISSNTGNFSTSGNIAVGQSATTPDPGANGTITTTNIGLARVTPAASRTGVIMQAGTVAGQKCTVVNNSASFTITFATAATSNVAQGTSLVIAALGKYDFTWDSIAARWY